MHEGPDHGVLSIRNVSKRYEIYERPADRLRQFLMPRLRGALLPGASPRAYFKEFWALRNISFELGRGEALGILGRNGAGKSTLLQIIAGTLAPTAGSLAIHGKVAALLELGSGFSPEFTGKENVRLNAALLGLTGEEIEQKYQQIVEFAGIGEFIDQPVKTYSTGMMLRLAFAVQTAVDPELLIVDEALAVGDARFQKKCFDRLETLLARGTTVLFVTHDTGAVVRLCSRAIVLEAGQIHADGTPSVVARQYHRLLFEWPVDNVDAGTHEVAPAASAPEGASSGSANRGTSLPAIKAEKPQVPGGAQPADRAVSPREVRYGSREVEVIEIGLRDAAGRPARVVEVHQRFELFFRIRFNATLADPVAYGFVISNARGIEVFATKAALYQKAIAPSAAGTICECWFRATMSMVPGTYFLTASIAYDGGSHAGEFLDCRFDALQFEVVGITRSFATCLVDLNGDLGHSVINHHPTNELGVARWG